MDTKQAMTARRQRRTKERIRAAALGFAQRGLLTPNVLFEIPIQHKLGCSHLAINGAPCDCNATIGFPIRAKI